MGHPAAAWSRLFYKFQPPAGYLLPSGRVDLSGTLFPRPKVQLNASAIYSPPINDLAGLSVDRVNLSYHIRDHSRFEADMRTINAMQETSPHEMSEMRLEVIGQGGGNIDFSLFAKNIFNEEACIPEQQGVLNSAPTGRSVSREPAAPCNAFRYRLAWPAQACRSRFD